MSYKVRLTANEVRSLEEGDYIVAELHEDEYWMQGEGRVHAVAEYPNGEVCVHFTSSNGYSNNSLTVPRDARKGLRLDGAARGARNLRVTRVYKYNR